MTAAPATYPCRACAGSGRWWAANPGGFGVHTDAGPCGYCDGTGRTATPPLPKPDAPTFLGLLIRSNREGNGVATDGVLRVLVTRTMPGGPLSAELSVDMGRGGGRPRICRMTHPELERIEAGLQLVVGHYEALPRKCPKCGGRLAVRGVDCDECYLAAVGGCTGRPICWSGEANNPCTAPAVAVSCEAEDAFPPSLCRRHLAEDLRGHARDLVEGGLIAGLSL